MTFRIRKKKQLQGARELICKSEQYRLGICIRLKSKINNNPKFNGRLTLSEQIRWQRRLS